MAAKRKPGAPLDNVRHELFCLFRVEGNPVSQAYERAGFKPDTRNAARVNRLPAVQARLAELQAIMADKVGVTVASLTAELDMAIDLAFQEKQPAAAQAAIMSKARLHGLDVSKSVNVSLNAFTDLSAEQLDFEIRQMVDEFRQLATEKKAISHR